MNEPIQVDQDSKHRPRHSYLLRLWRTNRSGSPNWHASLENPHTNERVGFANLEQLFAFLMALIERDEKRISEQSKLK
jgi:hypothetical protein